MFSAAFRPDGKTLVSGHRGGITKFWTVATLKPMFGPQDKGLASAYAIAIAPDSTVAAVGMNAIALFGGQGYTDDEVLHVGSRRLTSGAISPDSRTLAVGDETGNVVLWSLRERYPFEVRQPATEVLEPERLILGRRRARHSVT